MIQGKDLTKTYKSRRGGKCVALDRINFTLPDRGFVFVVGKSGSGKTTLLSLLGSLDTPTSGEIVVNGHSFSGFDAQDDVRFRNCEVGFIFQDFYLIEELTVTENVMLALQLQGEEDREKVLFALKEVELEGCGERYPKELSGGQKQRVAIARALVKQPKIILADEPTGNLDSKTTAQILTLLQKLSKDKLVVIVSHNLTDAQDYADEILELSEGHILQHVKRNPAFDPRLRLEGDTLVIPSGQTFSEDNVAAVNGALSRRAAWRVRQDQGRFRPCPETGSEGGMSEAEPLKRDRLRFRGRMAAAVKLSRHGWLRTGCYALILAAIMVVLGLSQLIMNFKGGEVLADEMAKRDLDCTAFIKDRSERYDSIDATRLVDVEEGDLEKFYEAGYTGKAYPLVNYALFNLGSNVCVSQQRLSPQANPYGVKESAGVLVTEESFIRDKFGSLEYAALCDTPKDHGIYITDFFADACIASHPDLRYSYASFLGRSNQFTGYCYGYINGVIKTGYRERYGELIGKLTDRNLSEEARKELCKTDECLAFYDETAQYLNIAYVFDPGFVEAAIGAKIRQFVSSGISIFEFQGKEYEYKASWFSSAELRNQTPLNDNEMIVNYDTYNKIFGTNYTLRNIDGFEPHEVKLSYYLLCDESKSHKKYEATLKIVGLNDNEARINVADNILSNLQHAEMFTFGYYFDGPEQTELLVDTASENGFLPNSSIAGSLSTMTKAVGVFSRFFGLIFAVLCVALLLLMVQYESKSIRDKRRDIGILKALGAREGDCMLVFGFQIAVAGILMILLYILGSFLFIGLANRILVLSLNELVKNTVVMDLDFLIVKGGYLIGNCLLALAIFALSFLVPMLRLRRIKPVNVIKAKE